MDKSELAIKLSRIQEVSPEPEDLEALSACATINDGETISLEEAKAVLEYSGKLNIRIPRSLHQKLSLEAKADGVSLNQYILYKLAR